MRIVLVNDNEKEHFTGITATGKCCTVAKLITSGRFSGSGWRWRWKKGEQEEMAFRQGILITRSQCNKAPPRGEEKISLRGGSGAREWPGRLVGRKEKERDETMVQGGIVEEDG